MGRHFEGRNEVTLDATPEQVWDAIATGPGMDSWFMGRNDVELGSTVRTAFGTYQAAHGVTDWQQCERLAYASKAPDGRAIAYEFLVEGRERASTVLRMVVSGFLPGDDWADEYEAMTLGGELFFRTLVEYLTHFAGRFATPVTVFGPPVDDWDHAWSVLHAELGGRPAVGDRVTLDDPAIDGVVYHVNAQTIGIRTDDAIYRFIQGFRGGMVVSIQSFEPLDPRAEPAWQSWLDRLFDRTAPQ